MNTNTSNEEFVLLPRKLTFEMRLACWKAQFVLNGATQIEAEILALRHATDPWQKQNDEYSYTAMIKEYERITNE